MPNGPYTKNFPPVEKPGFGQNSVIDKEKGGIVDIYKKQLLVKIDQLAAEADQFQADDPRRAQLVDQIAALNVAVSQHTQN